VRIERALRRIDELRAINAFVFVDRNASGNGLVVAVKDNIDVRGMPTTAGGRHFPTEARQRDAECVRRLRAAGCVIVGKTGLYEYAMGATSRNEHYGDVRNPRDPARDAGGSSSGSAAAVAADLCDAAVGTDTLGSVRIPAAFCGVVGYKPPRAAIPRRGVFPNALSLDSVGVLANDVTAAARLVDLMRAEPVRRRRPSRAPRLAVPWPWLDGVSDEVRDAFLTVARGLPDVALPARAEFGPAAFGVVQYEAYALHRAWLRSAPTRYGVEVRGLLKESASATRSRYEAAWREVARLRRRVRRALATVDATLLPTAPSVAPRRARYPLALRRSLSEWTRPFNVSDSAAFSIPMPGTRLPIGLQIVANDEATAIAVALELERRMRVRTRA
jgi:Asp-tRNA(Asn)/Glu-tRNA(Gln) amidotransferase A subunit family amidase